MTLGGASLDSLDTALAVDDDDDVAAAGCHQDLAGEPPPRDPAAEAAAAAAEAEAKRQADLSFVLDSNFSHFASRPAAEAKRISQLTRAGTMGASGRVHASLSPTPKRT